MANKHPTLTVEEDIEQTARLLRADWLQAPERLAEAVASCILELPHKREHYVSLLKELNKTDGSTDDTRINYGQVIFEALRTHFQASCEKGGPWRHTSQTILFLAAAVQEGVLRRAVLDRLYGDLFGLIPSVTIATADFIIWTFSAAAMLYDRQQTTLLNNIQAYLSQRSQLSYPIPRDLSTLIQLLADIGGDADGTGNAEANGAAEIDVQFEIAGCTLDGHWDGDFCLLSLDNEADALPTLDKWRTLYDCRVLTESLELNHRRCAEFLLTLTADEELVVTFLFGELLRRRQNGLPDLVYESLLMDCCRLERTFPPAMARFLHRLYGYLDGEVHYKLESPWLVVDRLSNWFSHHLSNFDYKWNWGAWQAVLKAPSTSLAAFFVRMTVEKLLHLSFPERVAPTLPEDFRQAFLPPEPTPYLAEESTVGREETELTALLTKAIEQRQPVESIKGLLPAADLDTGHREALLQALLLVGSKSLSHILAVIERYLPLFQLLLSDGGGTPLTRIKTNYFILDQVASFWRRSPLHFEFIVERLINYRILLPTAVIRWSLERADEQLAALDLDSNIDETLATVSSSPPPSLYQIITCRLSRNLLMRTLQQAATMPDQAQQRMRDAAPEKVANVVANLKTEYEEAVVLTIERLALLPVQLVSLSTQVTDLVAMVCTDYIREIASAHRSTLANLVPLIEQRLTTRIPSPVKAILDQISSG